MRVRHRETHTHETYIESEACNEATYDLTRKTCRNRFLAMDAHILSPRVHHPPLSSHTRMGGVMVLATLRCNGPSVLRKAELTLHK